MEDRGRLRGQGAHNPPGCCVPLASQRENKPNKSSVSSGDKGCPGSRCACGRGRRQQLLPARHGVVWGQPSGRLLLGETQQLRGPLSATPAQACGHACCPSRALVGWAWAQPPAATNTPATGRAGPQGGAAPGGGAAAAGAWWGCRCKVQPACLEGRLQTRCAGVWASEPGEAASGLRGGGPPGAPALALGNP